MGWSALGIVPWRVAAIAEFLMAFVPCPQFHKRMHPEIQMIYRNICPNVADLLLTRSPYFLHVVEVLLDGCPVCKCFQDFQYAGFVIGAEESNPSMIFLDKHHTNTPPTTG